MSATNCIYRQGGQLHRGRCIGGGAAYAVIAPEGRPDSEGRIVSCLDYWPTTDVAEVQARLRADEERASAHRLAWALHAIEKAVGA